MDQKTFAPHVNLSNDFLFGSPDAKQQGLTHVTPVETESYYRSKLITSFIAINDLTACAESLLLLVNRVKFLEANQSVESLLELLTHEVRAFESNSKQRELRLDTIMIARYMLCATLDDVIKRSTWGKQKAWRMHQLLNQFQHDDHSDEPFFIILNRLMRDAKHNRELLELAYICLRLGYEGKYHDQTGGKAQLDALVDNLYQCIRGLREEHEIIFLDKITIPTKQRTRKLTLALGPALILLMLLFLVSILLLNWRIHNLTSGTYQNLTQLKHTYQDYDRSAHTS